MSGAASAAQNLGDIDKAMASAAFQAAVVSDRPRITERGAIDPLARTTPILSKPLLAVVHGDTWNMGHELYLTRRHTRSRGRHALRSG
jgi:hypothetical protein